ncbi:hypothetical protein BDB01DRAFT_838043 [Pilobolus umbonatus]|nr:hypothetical protein BDB01DRAFT_838043 [Pilobolus umbonatus]
MTKNIKDSSPSLSPNQKVIQPNSVSFSDVITSTAIPSYAAVAYTPTSCRRTSVSKKSIARSFTPVLPTHGFGSTYPNCRVLSEHERMMFVLLYNQTILMNFSDLGLLFLFRQR